MKHILKTLSLAGLLCLSWLPGKTCLFAAEQPESEAVKTVWTSPELDGEVLELFFSPDTNVLYPEKVLTFNSDQKRYTLVYFNNSGGIEKTVLLAEGSGIFWYEPRAITWTPDGKKFCITNKYHGTLDKYDRRYLFNLYDENGKKLLTKDNAGITNAISPDGKYILTINGGKGMIELYDNNGRLIKAIDKPIGYSEGMGPSGKVQFVKDKIFVLIRNELTSVNSYKLYALKNNGDLLFKVEDFNSEYVTADFVASNNGDFVILHSGTPQGFLRKYDTRGKILLQADIDVTGQELVLSKNDQFLFAHQDGLAYMLNTATGVCVKIRNRNIGTSSRKIVLFDNGTAMFTSLNNNITFIKKDGEIYFEEVPDVHFLTKYFDLTRNSVVSISTIDKPKIVVKKINAKYMDMIKAKGDFAN